MELIQMIMVFNNGECLRIQPEEYDSLKMDGDFLLLKRNEYDVYAIRASEVLYVKNIFKGGDLE